jgi:hypothetical protein
MNKRLASIADISGKGDYLPGVRCGQRHYKEAMALFENYSDKRGTDGYIRHIDFVSDLVKSDLQSDCMTRLIYSGETLKRGGLENKGGLFEIGERLGININTREKIVLDLGKSYVFTVCWSGQKLFDNVTREGGSPFRDFWGDHTGYYYKTMDYACVVNGVHSVTAALREKRGKLSLMLFDDTPLFERVVTDGAYWIDAQTFEVLGEVSDFRLALIYSLTRLKYQLA